LDSNQEGLGFFLGYDPEGRKILIKNQDLDKCLKNISHGVYTVKFQLTEKSNFNFVKWCIQALIPQKIKDQIANEITI